MHPVMRYRIALFALLATALVAAGCGGSSSDRALLSLASSAKKTVATSAYRTEMRMSMTLPGLDEDVSFVATGAVDNAARRQAVSMDMSSLLDALGGLLGGSAKLPSADQLRLDLVVDGTDMYMRMPFATNQLPGGKSWLRMDLAKVAAQQGVDLSSLMSQSYADPSQFLDYMTQATGPVETVGSETVRGVETRHLRGTLDLKAYVEKLDPKLREKVGPVVDRFVEMSGAEPRIDAWVDDQGLVRRMAMEMNVGAGGQGEAKVGMSVDLFDFGTAVDVALPPASEVVDATALGSLGP